jgi:DNA-binding transcriptional ArsR family regulator
MLDRLSQGPASVSELGRLLSISLAAVVQHVQVLGASGLVRSQKAGRTGACTLNPATLRSAERWISDRRTLIERRLDRLGEYLAETAGSPDSEPQDRLRRTIRPDYQRRSHDRAIRHP